jgi:hypothetical protein
VHAGERGPAHLLRCPQGVLVEEVTIGEVTRDEVGPARVEARVSLELGDGQAIGWVVPDGRRRAGPEKARQSPRES